MTKAHIMIVEDQRIIALSLEKMLRKLGYEVPIVVSSGEEAVEQALKTHPDLVLMDIALEGEMDGIEAAAQIRQHLNIPTIYLTANSDEQTLERAIITQPFGYLLKPFEEREIYAAIEVAFYKHQAETEREKLIIELQEALTKVKVLSGLIPICASCKNIRDDQGYWQRVEAYIEAHSEVEFSHGLCPECIQRLYPEYSNR